MGPLPVEELKEVGRYLFRFRREGKELARVFASGPKNKSSDSPTPPLLL